MFNFYGSHSEAGAEAEAQRRPEQKGRTRFRSRGWDRDRSCSGQLTQWIWSYSGQWARDMRDRAIGSLTSQHGGQFNRASGSRSRPVDRGIDDREELNMVLRSTAQQVGRVSVGNCVGRRPSPWAERGTCGGGGGGGGGAGAGGKNVAQSGAEQEQQQLTAYRRRRREGGQGEGEGRGGEDVEQQRNAFSRPSRETNWTRQEQELAPWNFTVVVGD
ncbi:hypothetical protein MARPO_0025s0083 [Marchantia polymorpha]|uniref:Uncharacterized protein n=1 Tax=Marchantia polymorpha TaxID=3197 RepID=A0A2R6XB98_MARPO|nr:hypothetical protein MARPO_0025s0083 [Marchantia polymorpha]|eukprot:PTQ43393.1 hypothetical protein MARPO_0025s0083 [Marchantia polymorpha]